MIALLTEFGIELTIGGLVGPLIGYALAPVKQTFSANVLKAALSGLDALDASDREPTKAEIETMQRMDIFG